MLNTLIFTRWCGDKVPLGFLKRVGKLPLQDFLDLVHHPFLWTIFTAMDNLHLIPATDIIQMDPRDVKEVLLLPGPEPWTVQRHTIGRVKEDNGGNFL